ncbi:MAG: DNA mismatch repair protein MutS [Thermodesulfobacteriota bacterium]
MNQTRLTPMLKQYLGIKEAYPDALLFFRMGDFYELFFQDAEVTARELQIALTSRGQNQEDKVPMCGVPYHSLHEYLSQLLEKRYKVAICDQVEDPAQAKGLVKREVTRVLTPGTVLEENSLQAKSNNFLAAVYTKNKGTDCALAWVDHSTGEWTGMQSASQSEIRQWLLKLDPREIICQEQSEAKDILAQIQDRVSWLPAAYFDYSRAKENILSLQQVAGLRPLDLEDKPLLVQACGALLAYLRQTQKQDLVHLGSFQPLDLSRHLILDEVSERNLEIFQRLDGSYGQGTLWHILDLTRTSMGGRLLRTRLKRPWKDLKTIQAQQEVLRWLLEQEGLLQSLSRALDSVFDIYRLNSRIALNRTSPRDLISLRGSLQELPGIEKALQDCLQSQAPPQKIKEILEAWDNLGDISELLQSSLRDNPPQLITEGGIFRAGYDTELDELLELDEHGQSKLQELLKKEQTENDLPKLKLGYNRVFGYYFELSKAHKGPIPEHFHRKQTLVNAERYLTQELKELEDKLFSATERRKSLEYELFQKLRQQIDQARERINHMAGSLAWLDYWQCLAEAARKWGWNQPELNTSKRIQIKQGRHPAVEAVQGKSNYIPNDLYLEPDNNILLITGPNMAGKSTVLRQAAIISILAQIGSYVPADAASLGICDRIFTRVGASDNLAQGESTFMVEMTETARILRQAGKRSLVILDEIGRGTSTYDGLALAWAVLENLSSKSGLRVLFATHYHELTDLEGKLPGLRNYNIAVKEWKGDIVFLRRLVPGPADRSYGIEVARLAGVPKGVIKRAREILQQLEEKSARIRPGRGKGKEGARLQPLLPGLKPAQEKQKPAAPQAREQELLQELANLDLEQITPLQALNLLQSWKEKWQLK